MDLTRKQRTIKYISYCAVLAAAELIQNVAGILPEPFGARCFLVIPAAVLLVIGEDEVNAAFLGMFAGLLWDLTSSVHMGFNFIFFSVICFFVAALVNHLLRDTFLTNILICALVTALYSFLYWLLFIVIKGVEGGAGTLFSFYLPCTVYTSIASMIVFLIIKPLKQRLNKSHRI